MNIKMTTYHHECSICHTPFEYGDIKVFGAMTKVGFATTVQQSGCYGDDLRFDRQSDGSGEWMGGGIRPRLHYMGYGSTR